MTTSNSQAATKPVTQGLTALPVGESASWPTKQLDSLRSSFYRLSKKHRMRFSYVTEDGTIKVTRKE